MDPLKRKSPKKVKVSNVGAFLFSSHNVRFHLDKYVKQALADKKITSIVIAGKNNNFSAGADIKEFGGENKRGKCPFN